MEGFAESVDETFLYERELRVFERVVAHHSCRISFWFGHSD
jgi:hypothetical protein